jgi:hypothetical protein
VTGAPVPDVCLVAPPFLDGDGVPITVPPKGYGGIQWSMVHIIDGLVEAGVECTLLGAPGSAWPAGQVDVIPIDHPQDIADWIIRQGPSAVADFANFSALDLALPTEIPYTTTWQLTGHPPGERNPIYVSWSQRHAAGDRTSPVIRLGANPARFRWSAEDDGYLLFLGRVAPWKGAMEAAWLAEAAGLELLVAGPVFEPEYRDALLAAHGDHVVEVGEVHGDERLTLLARARAVVALSQDVEGPWGARWCEPGSAVVAEAALSGTPVIGSDNGCLREIVPHVGTVVPGGDPSTVDISKLLAGLPTAEQVRSAATEQWGHTRIAGEHLEVLGRAARGERWGATSL